MICKLFRKSYHELKFTALEVREGDAFLLENDGWKSLFDSSNDDDIENILSKHGVQNIDLAICSHNDDDHATGFIKILKSKKVTEIWLPSLWANILQFVSDKKNIGNRPFDIDHYLKNYKRKKKYVKKDEDFDFLYGKDSVSATQLNDQLSEFFIDYKDYIEKLKITTSHPLYNAYNRIIKIAYEAKQCGCDIKWFQPLSVPACYAKHYKYDCYPLNSMPVDKIQKIKSAGMVAKAVHLSTVNKYSLAFEYYYNEIPVIRFSADTHSTCQTAKYTNSIIITAPHHGSLHNAIVYKNLLYDAEKTIWVRTYHRSVTPCKKFKLLNNKYCVRCNANLFTGQRYVQFEYNINRSRWDNIAGYNCQSPKC